MIYTTGNHGNGVRSDCFLSLDVELKGGISIQLTGRTKALYGNSIVQLCRDILAFFGIQHAKLEIDDSGALPFTIAARLEAVIKKHLITNKEFLLPIIPQNNYSTARDADRVTRLYLPGNNPKLMINAGIYGSKGIILDLEDSVAPDKKSEARFLVRNALRSVDFYGAERMVRINQLPAGLEDLNYCVPHKVNLILIPKCELASEVKLTNAKISEILGRENDTIHLMPIIESAAGVMNAYEIARSSENVVALAIGLEDYTADMGTQRTPEGKETYFARSMVVNAARAAGIQPIDSVFSDIDDMEALARIVIDSKSLGFAGMGCIHPRQVAVIHENFMPTEVEIDQAKRVVWAYERTEKEGAGVVALDSKMIDAPVVKRALKTIEKAVYAGRIPKNWRDGNEQ
jgi:citrate lyase subunit beta/citryl-CoA lyase